MVDEAAADDAALLKTSVLADAAEPDFAWEHHRLRINCGLGLHVVLPTMIG